jgi:ABC transport system ATP-binding/permease protein
MFIGAAVGAAVLGGGAVFLIAHAKKQSAGVELAANPPTPGPENAAPPNAAPANPPVAVAVAKPDLAVPQPASPQVEKPAQAAAANAKPLAAVSVAAPDEVKAPPPDAEARKLASAASLAAQKLKARDPAAALELLHGVRELAVGDAQYEALLKHVQAEKENQALVEDSRRGTPSSDNLKALADVPETSVFYADAQRLLTRYEKQAKVALKAREKKSAKLAAASEPAPAPADDKPARSAELLASGRERLRSGDTNGALPILKKAVELDGNSSENLRTLAGCLARLNRFDEAAVYYRRFLVVAPNDPAAPTIRSALKNYNQGK